MAPAVAEPAAELLLEAGWAALDEQELASHDNGRAPPQQDGIGLQPVVTEAEMNSMVTEALARLQLHGTGEDVEHTADEEWLQQVSSIALPGDAFQAGNIRLHLPAFRMFFEAAGSLRRKPVMRVLRWLETGMPIEFCEPRAPSQQQHPRFVSRLRQVEQLLSQELPPDRISSMLTGERPHRIAFRNRVSCNQHADWVAEHLNELVEVGALRHWPPEWGEPVVISGMGVVPKAGGKLRLILDCRYLNLFVRYAGPCAECASMAAGLLVAGLVGSRVL